MTSKLEPNRAQRPTLVGYLLYKSFPQFPQEKKKIKDSMSRNTRRDVSSKALEKVSKKSSSFRPVTENCSRVTI